jgi:hypothetical protein
MPGALNLHATPCEQRTKMYGETQSDDSASLQVEAGASKLAGDDEPRMEETQYSIEDDHPPTALSSEASTAHDYILQSIGAWTSTEGKDNASYPY